MRKLAIYMPGRLSSERLPNKLILPIAGTNLWEIACKKLSQIQGFDVHVLVSDQSLISIAEKYGINVKDYQQMT